MNLAEVIRASWAHYDRANLSLLDAGQADTRDSVLLEEELKAFEKGNVKGGVGPSYMERRERTRKKEVLGAAQIGKEISKLRGNVVTLLLDTVLHWQKQATRRKGTTLDLLQVPTHTATPQFRLPPSHVSHTPTQLVILSPKNHHTVTKQVILLPAAQQPNRTFCPPPIQ